VTLKGGMLRVIFSEDLRNYVDTTSSRMIKFGRLSQVMAQHVSKESANLCPRPKGGKKPNIPKFLGPTCVQMVRETETKFCMVIKTRREDNIFSEH